MRVIVQHVSSQDVRRKHGHLLVIVDEVLSDGLADEHRLLVQARDLNVFTHVTVEHLQSVKRRDCDSRSVEWRRRQDTPHEHVDRGLESLFRLLMTFAVSERLDLLLMSGCQKLWQPEECLKRGSSR